MPKTRLFHTLIICGAALTGGTVATIVTAATVAGCSSDDTSITIIDQAIPEPRDMAMHPHDMYVIID
jgi:hypothetical protein